MVVYEDTEKNDANKESRSSIPKKLTEVNWRTETKEVSVTINPQVHEGEIKPQEVFIAQIKVSIGWKVAA